MTQVRPCVCDNCPKDAGFPVGKGYCYDCWRFWNVPKYRAKWGGVGSVAPRQITRPPAKKCCGQDAEDLAYTGD